MIKFESEKINKTSHTLVKKQELSGKAPAGGHNNEFGKERMAMWDENSLISQFVVVLYMPSRFSEKALKRKEEKST